LAPESSLVSLLLSALMSLSALVSESLSLSESLSAPDQRTLAQTLRAGRERPLSRPPKLL
jgi:hypothetical protein